MKYRWLFGSFAAVTIVLGLALGTSDRVLAQGAAEPESLWVKICQTDPNTKKELCLITQEIRAETGQFIASATLRQFTGDKKISFIAAVPPGMLLQPGVRAQIDKQEPKDIKYGICFPNACFGEMEVDESYIQALKKGGDLVISALNQGGKQANFRMSLAGFTKTWDGPGLDPKGGQEAQSKLNEVLQERALKARQKLIEQQRNSSGK